MWSAVSYGGLGEGTVDEKQKKKEVFGGMRVSEKGKNENKKL